MPFLVCNYFEYTKRSFLKNNFRLFFFIFFTTSSTTVTTTTTTIIIVVIIIIIIIIFMAFLTYKMIGISNQPIK